MEKQPGAMVLPEDNLYLYYMTFLVNISIQGEVQTLICFRTQSLPSPPESRDSSRQSGLTRPAVIDLFILLQIEPGWPLAFRNRRLILLSCLILLMSTLFRFVSSRE